MSEGPPVPKRAKLFRACDACVSSKTRCDDLQPTGCALCRKKNRYCSLIDESTRASVDPTEEIRETRSRLDTMEARTWELELRIRQIESTSMASSMQSVPAMETRSSFSLLETPGQIDLFGSNADAGPSRTGNSDGRREKGERQMVVQKGDTSRNAWYAEEEEHDLWILGNMGSTRNWPFDERIYSMQSNKGFPDVVKRDLVSRNEVDMAFQLWKYRFSTVLPLAPFLLTSTPTPTHPFVIAAILSHLPAFNTTSLHHLINESIAHAMRGAIDADVVLAFLLLSVAHCSPIVPSPMRLIAMAYELGLALGYESNQRSALELGDDQALPCWRVKLDEMLLWEAVKMQYNMSHLAKTRVMTLLSSSARHMPVPPADNYREAIGHLVQLSAMLECFRPNLEAVARAESDSVFGIADLAGLTDSWSELQDRLNKHRATYPDAGMAIVYLEFSLGYRIVKFFQGVPTPVSPSLKVVGYNTIGAELLRISSVIVEYWNELDIETNPPLSGLTYSVVVGAVGTILAVYAAVYKQHPNFLGLDIERTKTAEAKVHALGGISSLLLKRMREEFAAELDKPDERATVAALYTEGGARDDAGADSDTFDQDLSAWSWLFANMVGDGRSGGATST